ncbi:MAG: MaoC/PaaZ C-terminal domain-containing protein [Micromonosporaceae bacterium]
MRTVELAAAPSLTPMLVKAVLRAPTRRGGELPDTELALGQVRADPEQLAAYSRVCGFGLGSQLPGTYPHILGFPLAMRLMTDPEFPFPLPGLVHIGNQIVQHRPLAADGEFTIRTHAAELNATERGVEFEIRTEAHLGDDLAWEERSHYLRRAAGGRGNKSGSARPEPAAVTPTAVWRLPGDLGRRYARVSGDHNPIHLHPLGARLAGFSRPIAHGMWILARCLSALEGRLPDAYRVDVRFRRPIALPSTVGFTANRDAGGWLLGVRDRQGRKTHLEGSAEPL